MAREDFERFRQEKRSWMDAHPDEYDAFVEEVNGKSFEGIQRVYSLAMRLAPQLMAKVKEQVHGDLNRTDPDASIFTADDTLAEQLVAEFRNTEKILPRAGYTNGTETNEAISNPCAWIQK